MSFKCNFCNNTFIKKFGLTQHLSGRCKSELLVDTIKLNELLSKKNLELENLKKQIVTITLDKVNATCKQGDENAYNQCFVQPKAGYSCYKELCVLNG